MSAVLVMSPPVWVDEWWLRVPWTSSLGLPFWRLVASAEYAVQWCMLGWADVDYRIRCIDRSGDGTPEVFDIPTRAAPAQVDRWWEELAGPGPDSHAHLLALPLKGNNTGDAQGPTKEPVAASVRALEMAVVLGERR